jgi:hypothetical protein
MLIFLCGMPLRGAGSRRYRKFNPGGKAMLMRFASIISVLSLVACVLPAEEARQQSVPAAIQAGEPIAGSQQAREAWWPVQFADENKCIIQGYQEGTDAFAQCVRITIEQQSQPHRCIYCRSLD